MPRGGKRSGAGRPSSWNNGQTTVIRVPETLADSVLELARELDQNDYIEEKFAPNTVERPRLNNGTFAPKSSQPREVRSLRLTDKTWEALARAAELKGITRADLIEELVINGVIEQWVHGSDDFDPKTVNLSGITTLEIGRKRVVFLSDLVKSGYLITPDDVALKVIDEIYEEQLAAEYDF